MTTRPHTLIVGGTRGIGRAVAARLAHSGHAVSVIGRSTPAKADANVRVWTADVADSGRLATVLDEIGREQGRVSGAVLLQRFRGDGDDWAGEIATSLDATRQVIDWVGNHAESRGQGPAIVVVGSTAASFIASEQPVSYHMAKAAVIQMVRYYAVALGPKGIRVNAVSPGTTVKDESKQFYADHPELEQLYRDIVPLGRMGTAADVAGVVAFLLGDDASFLTGQNIALDGGATLQAQESLARRVSPLKDLPVTRKGKA
jgi:NAD(P)-dependent dehydrogenase (short-subunit alcohol dehydrogenase family)